jgi:very-short-patch-repair endonuclease
MSELEDKLAFQIRAYGLPKPIREYKFAREVVGDAPGIRQRLREAKLKDWRFDFAWVDLRLAVEVEGGSFTQGRHNRPVGFEQDTIKYGEAMALGWTVYRCSTGLIKSGKAIEQIIRIYKLKQSHMCGEKWLETGSP